MGDSANNIYSSLDVLLFVNETKPFCAYLILHSLILDQRQHEHEGALLLMLQVVWLWIHGVGS